MAKPLTYYPANISMAGLRDVLQMIRVEWNMAPALCRWLQSVLLDERYRRAAASCGEEHASQRLEYPFAEWRSWSRRDYADALGLVTVLTYEVENTTAGDFLKFLAYAITATSAAILENV